MQPPTILRFPEWEGPTLNWWLRCLNWLSPPATPRLGAQGERLAEQHLRQLGYRILARNMRNRGGEIDLIARDAGTIVFVEVRSRSDRTHGEPAETISRAKQRTLTRAALSYLKQRGQLDTPARFDVVTIVWGQHPGEQELRHIPNAFPASE